jgi:hypothetical protein
MREKPTNTPTIHSVYYLRTVDPKCFGITLPSSGSVPSAFWEMLNWGAVDRILWMGISQKALETLHEDGNVMPKHVGASIHN